MTYSACEHSAQLARYVGLRKEFQAKWHAGAAGRIRRGQNIGSAGFIQGEQQQSCFNRDA